MTSRPRTPARVAPAPEALPAITENNNTNNNSQPSQNNQTATRRTSFGFLRRSKSTEPLGERKTSNGKMKKKQVLEEESRRRQSMSNKPAPRLPDLSPAPVLETFGGERPETADAVPSQVLTPPSVAPPASPPKSAESVDPYARTESMTHRGRFSYASSTVSTFNSPRRLRRRKDPTPYK